MCMKVVLHILEGYDILPFVTMAHYSSQFHWGPGRKKWWAIAEYQEYVQLAVSPTPCFDMSCVSCPLLTSKIIHWFVVYSTVLGGHKSCSLHTSFIYIKAVLTASRYFLLWTREHQVLWDENCCLLLFQIPFMSHNLRCRSKSKGFLVSFNALALGYCWFLLQELRFFSSVIPLPPYPPQRHIPHTLKGTMVFYMW